MEQPAAGAPAADQAPLYTPDEAKILEDHEKNWADVSQAESLKRRGEYHDLLKYVFQQVHGFLEPHLQTVGALQNTIFAGELTKAVPDYTPALEADVGKWIDTQPAYLQAPYKQVMQSGTSDEIADLIGRYRGATGTQPAPVAPPAPAGQAPAAIPPKPPTELSSAAMQAADSLAPVGSERTQITSAQDPGDFQSAFARYAAESMPT